VHVNISCNIDTNIYLQNIITTVYFIMNPVKSLISIFTITGFCLIFFTCSNDLSSTSDFMIHVDSIRVPETVNQSKSFDIGFFGVIGFNGCYSFKTFNRVIKGNEITIEAFGTLDEKSSVCPDVLVTLDGIKLSTTISISGTYQIVIKEPDSFTLIKQIIVN